MPKETNGKSEIQSEKIYHYVIGKFGDFGGSQHMFTSTTYDTEEEARKFLQDLKKEYSKVDAQIKKTDKPHEGFVI